MQCIVLIVIVALAAVNAASLKTSPAPLETSIVSAYPYYNGLDALSYRGFAGLGHPFSGYSSYYGARFGYDAPLAYGGLPAYSGVPSVIPKVYSSPLAYNTPFSPLAKWAYPHF